MKKLNFGCGNDIKEGWENADVQEGEEVISFDFNKFPYPIKDDTYDYVEARQCLNLLNNPDEVLYELRRITKRGGVIWIKVPYWHNKGAYNDIQTIHWFNENSFIHFANQYPCRIDTKKRFELIRLEKTTTIFGKFLLLEWIRKKLDLFISGIYSNMEIELKVVK